jgi:hypothetical protein
MRDKSPASRRLNKRSPASRIPWVSRHLGCETPDTKWTRSAVVRFEGVQLGLRLRGLARVLATVARTDPGAASMAGAPGYMADYADLNPRRTYKHDH